MIARRYCLPLIALCVFVTGFGAIEDKETKFIGSRGKYWAFQKIVRPQPPASGDPWVRTPIDAFILDALRVKNLQPSPPVDRVRLIRRVTFDLTGLPPTPSEVDAFLKDRSAGAYEKLVDRLLASPHYGERWASKWLDVTRYADTNGFELDADRPHSWRYRDYVISAFNRDKPYDRFVKEQIAGDEIYPENKEALIATGYARAGQEHIVAGNIDPEVSRQEVLTEIATSVGRIRRSKRQRRRDRHARRKGRLDRGGQGLQGAGETDRGRAGSSAKAGPGTVDGGAAGRTRSQAASGLAHSQGEAHRGAEDPGHECHGTDRADLGRGGGGDDARGSGKAHEAADEAS
jgi:hypothetical protein